MQAIYTTDVEIGLLKNPGFEKNKPEDKKAYERN